MIIQSAKAKYSINFTESRKGFALVCITMEATVSYLLMLQKYIDSKQESGMKPYCV